MAVHSSCVSGPFVWPDQVKTPTITEMFGLTLGDHSLRLPDKETLAGKRVREAYMKCVEKDISPFEKGVIVDVGSSEKFASYRVEASPCLTATRCAQRNYFCSLIGDRLTTNQLQQLQGVDPDRIRWEGVISSSQMGRIVGNGNCQHVMERLLPHVLLSAGLIRRLPWSR